ncbi:hypothetical protein KY330_01480 [Candidatus Woesearchaeota archaeon]|nr:hypothetical protein [Candidatus Woesearchaeota archaeon]
MPTVKALEEYIRKTLSQGHSAKEIRDFLIKKENISRDLVDKAFKELKKEPPKFRKFKITPRTLEITGIVVLVLVVFFIIVFSGEKSLECSSASCFIDAAQECKSVTFVQEEVGSEILYEIKDGCVLEKSILNFGPNEPVEVVQLFESRKMTCPYPEENFNPASINSLLEDIDACSGELKDAIFELRLAQYELLQG